MLKKQQKQNKNKRRICIFTKKAVPLSRIMAHKIQLILICLLLATCAYAETIVLRTGARVKGSIVFQNEEVVIFRDASGARFQYPRSDVQEIIEAETVEQVQEEEQQEKIETTKKVSILIELAGGAAVVPNDKAGGAFSAELLVGSHHIGDKHLFVGAGVGYHGFFFGAEKYNFLPVQAAVRMPLIEQKHAPVFGAALGYGIALSKTYLGGLYAGVDFGYRCQINEKTAVALVAFAQFQQAKIKTTEFVDDVPFSNNTGRSLVFSGLKLGLYF